MDQLIESDKQTKGKIEEHPTQNSEPDNNPKTESEHPNLEPEMQQEVNSHDLITDSDENIQQKKQASLLLKKQANTFFVDQNFQEVS